MARSLSIFCERSVLCVPASHREISSTDCSLPKGSKADAVIFLFARTPQRQTAERRHFQGREERSTFPPEKITPSFGAPPSAPFGRFNDATNPGLSNGAIATALDG